MIKDFYPREAVNFIVINVLFIFEDFERLCSHEKKECENKENEKKDLLTWGPGTFERTIERRDVNIRCMGRTKHKGKLKYRKHVKNKL